MIYPCRTLYVYITTCIIRYCYGQYSAHIVIWLRLCAIFIASYPILNFHDAKGLVCLVPLA